ncbi:NUDIX hydrolase [Barnesiella intestinihominis]|jgi:hydrolase, NUDIX family|uniref:NUDIX hydrolase n=1 Tax=Barnesiella intestinihominis TaxID=487174 RepID=UPI003AB7CD1C
MHPLRLFEYCPRCGSHRFQENDASSKRCKDCGFVYYLNPKASVAAFVMDRQSRILVCRRAFDPSKGMLDLPGGFTECGETVEEAVVRELSEEIGWKPKQMKYLCSFPNVYRYSGFDVHTMDLFFLCRSDEDMGDLKAHDDVAECFWLRKEEIEPEKFAFRSICKAVDRLLKDDKYWVKD